MQKNHWSVIVSRGLASLSPKGPEFLLPNWTILCISHLVSCIGCSLGILESSSVTLTYHSRIFAAASRRSHIGYGFVVAAIIFCIAAVVPDVSCAAAAEETEILEITVGKATKLSTVSYQNTSQLCASRTGIVAAFYPTPPKNRPMCRISNDAGKTWGKEADPPSHWGGAVHVGLRDGGVIKLRSDTPPTNDKPGWFDVKSFKFTDDFSSWEAFMGKMYMPKNVHSLDVPTPSTAKGPIIQLPDGDLLMPMYGGFQGDEKNVHRAYLVHSTDEARTWRYYATIDYSPKDPNPELPGQYVGACEPSVVLLPNGQMLAIMRKQLAHFPGEYKPLYVCWSDDLGKTWTKPIPTKPHLMNISPTLQVLDNGVVAVEYGRPGCHVAFSINNGHTWQDKISFSNQPEPIVTGQFDMVKAGANELVIIGSDKEGTKVWPITVQRVKVSPAHMVIEGRILDQKGKPIAAVNVELSPNRYALDAWLEDPKVLDHFGRRPRTIDTPVLGYRPIKKENKYPTVQADNQGRYRFKSAKLGEYVLTVEANGYAPQFRHIKVEPKAKAQDFSMKAGRKVSNRVEDTKGKPIAGACVVLNNWHSHTDPDGFFHWSVESPLPEKTTYRVNKRYSAEIRGSTAMKYDTLKGTVAISTIERQPFVLHE